MEKKDGGCVLGTLTLRDLFAMAAFNSFTKVDRDQDTDGVANSAYATADAMLRRREECEDA